MNKKKLFSLTLTCFMFSQLFSSSLLAQEKSELKDTMINANTNTNNQYKFVRYENPSQFMYDGTTVRLLGYYEIIQESEMNIRGDYYEYDRWFVYDYGITNTWSWLSNPYFVKSIARGETHEKSTDITATIQGSISGSYPQAAKPSIISAFDFSSSLSKTISEKIILSGPDSPYTSRDFFYKKGTHTHKIQIVQKTYSNWDGLIYQVDHGYYEVEEPAIKSYSVDTY